MSFFFFNGYYSYEMGLIVEDKNIWGGPQPEYFRYAVFVSQLNIEEVINNVGRAVLTFSCKPYLYRKDGAMAEKYTQSGFVLTNPEEYPSVPDITIYGSGTISLNINYRSYTIKDVASSVTLDGELMHAYSGTTPLNEKIRFTEFPFLRPGDNQISWGGTGTVRSVYIAPNWRTL